MLVKKHLIQNFNPICELDFGMSSTCFDESFYFKKTCAKLYVSSKILFEISIGFFI